MAGGEILDVNSGGGAPTDAAIGSPAPHPNAPGGAAMHAAAGGAAHPNTRGGALMLAATVGTAPHPNARGGAAAHAATGVGAPHPNARGGAPMLVAAGAAAPHPNARGGAAMLAGPALPPVQQFFDVEGGLEGPPLGRSSLIFFYALRCCSSAIMSWRHVCFRYLKHQYSFLYASPTQAP